MHYSSGPKIKEGQVRLLSRSTPKDDHVLIVGLGKKDKSQASLNEGHDLTRESIRSGVSLAIRSLRDLGIEDVAIDDCGDGEAAAEGAYLGLWSYDFLKAKKDALKNLNIKPLHGNLSSESWSSGLKKAKGQNFARTLMETPANYLTPKLFAKQVKAKMDPLSKVEAIPRDLAWIKEQKMGSFLSVSQGSAEDPVFLEMTYQGDSEDKKPIVLVGKGVTFDTGGISLKPSKDMDKMRGDMGGAATVTGCLYTVANLGLPVNLKVLIPLCENMPSSKATKPGDVVIAKNGKSIQVDNTDAEGRLILADALCYADTFQPQFVMDAATLTGAVAVAIGGAAAGVYSTNDKYWDLIQQAGYVTGDRVWRMPLWNFYSEQMKSKSILELTEYLYKAFVIWQKWSQR